MFGVYCPRCSNEGIIVGVEQFGNRKTYTFFCFNCDNDWPEEISFPERDESRNMNIDSILLGLEIFEVASECSLILERSLERRAFFSEEGKRCLEELKHLKKKRKEQGVANFKKAVSVASLEIFKIMPEYALLLEEYVEEGISASKQDEKMCLEKLKYLQSLLSKIENEWGLLRLKKVLLLYNGNVEWGIKALYNLFQLSEGKIKKEVEKIIKYLRIAKRTKISSLR